MLKGSLVKRRCPGANALQRLAAGEHARDDDTEDRSALERSTPATARVVDMLAQVRQQTVCASERNLMQGQEGATISHVMIGAEYGTPVGDQFLHEHHAAFAMGLIAHAHAAMSAGASNSLPSRGSIAGALIALRIHKCLGNHDTMRVDLALIAAQSGRVESEETGGEIGDPVFTPNEEACVLSHQVETLTFLGKGPAYPASSVGAGEGR